MPTTAEVNTAALNFIADTDTANAKINGAPGLVTDRHGAVTANLEKILSNINFDVPVAFASGLSITSGRNTVEYAGQIYAAKPSATPFTTTGTFVAADWYLVTQGSFTQGGTGAVLRTTQSKLEESVTVTDFGATGDGVTDDTSAIAAAFSAAGPSHVIFPDGQYVLTTTITTGSGKVTGPGSILHEPTVDGTDALVLTSDFAVVDGLTIKNTGSDSSDKFTGYAIKATGDYAVIQNCTVISAHNANRTASSVGGAGADQYMISDCFGVVGGVGCRMTGNRATGGFYAGLRFHETERSVASSNIIENGYRAYMISGDDVSVFSFDCQISNNAFAECHEMCGKIEQGCERNVVSRNHVRECSQDVTLNGDLSMFVCQGNDNAFVGNTINCPSLNSSLPAVFKIGGAGGGLGDRCRVEGNHLIGCDVNGSVGGSFRIIWLQEVKNCSVSHNVIEGCDGEYIYIREGENNSANGNHLTGAAGKASVTLYQEDSSTACDNSIRSTTATAMEIVSGTGLVVVGNSLHDIGNATGHRGIHVSGTTKGGVVQGNMLMNIAGDGIRATTGTLGNMHSIAFTGNTAVDCGDRGFEFSKLENCNLSGNIERNSTGTGFYANGCQHCQISGIIAESYDLSGNTNSNEMNNVTNTVS